MITDSIFGELRVGLTNAKEKKLVLKWISILYNFNQLINIIFKKMKGILTLILYSNKILKYPLLCLIVLFVKLRVDLTNDC